MSLNNVFNIAGSALNAQSVRLNTISSNLANVDTVASSPEDVYKARYPVFSSVYGDAINGMGKQHGAGAAAVRVDGIVESEASAQEIHDPQHPMANEDGNVYKANINSVDEMVNMISASRTYQSSIEAINTTKQLMIQTLSLGR